MSIKTKRRRWKHHRWAQKLAKYALYCEKYIECHENELACAHAHPISPPLIGTGGNAPQLPWWKRLLRWLKELIDTFYGYNE